MSKNILLCELESECCGCSACLAVCPKDAISMAENSEGFLYPSIDERLCIECGLCLKVCPLKSETVKSDNKKVGILCLSQTNNYGAKIVAAALQNKVKSLLPDGAEVGVIEHEPQIEKAFLDGIASTMNPLKIAEAGKRFVTVRHRGKLADAVASKRGADAKDIRDERFNSFNEKYINVLAKTKLTSEFKNTVKGLDAIIVGSDIVFRPEYAERFPDVYLLGCMKNSADNITKLSYAASVSSDSAKVLNPLKENYKEGMKNFDCISVREKSSKEFLENLTHKKVEYCCDPVLLYTGEDFDFVPDLNESGYVYVNVLDKNKAAVSYTEALATKRGLNIKYFSDLNSFEGSNAQDVYSDGPLKFIERIRSADYVITNSFHTIVFSILFKKKFAAFLRADQSLKISDLLSTLGIENRLVTGSGKGFDIDSEINWGEVDKKLEAFRETSLEYLRKALNK